jgi:hypothetical protein
MATGRIIGEKPAQKLTSPQMVHYIGTANVREIDTASWDIVEATDHQKIRWDRSNGWAIPVDKFSDTALSWLDTQPDFVIKDVEVPRADES